MFQGKCLSVWLVMCKKSDKFNNFYELCGDINSEMTPFVLSYYMVSVYFISKHYLIFFLNLVKWLKPMIPNWDWPMASYENESYFPKRPGWLMMLELQS